MTLNLTREIWQSRPFPWVKVKSRVRFGGLGRKVLSGEYVLICVAWPYANGPLHLGHVAGCYLPPDIQARFERARGNRVLMVWIVAKKIFIMSLSSLIGRKFYMEFSHLIIKT